MSYSVCKLDTNTNTYITLYDCIENISDAELLAQFAMTKRRDFNELIFMFPGWNRSIDKNETEYKKALKLANEYKSNDTQVQKSNLAKVKAEIADLLTDAQLKLRNV